jgi:predicted RNA-binding protein with PIN domain
VAEPTLYLFDGHNLLYTGSFEDPRKLIDQLASFVALSGARGVVVFDGSGDDQTYGPLEVVYAPHADTVLERLAAENRDSETVCLISSDSAVRGTSGQEVQKRSSRTFLGDLDRPEHGETSRYRVGDRVDDETRKRLEKMRRGQGSGQ